MARLILLDSGPLDLILRAPSKPQVVRCLASSFRARVKPLQPVFLSPEMESAGNNFKHSPTNYLRQTRRPGQENGSEIMYEYEFARCPIQFARGQGVQTESYRSMIEEYARKGWRLVQVLVQVPAAVPSEYELIFERARVG